TNFHCSPPFRRDLVLRTRSACGADRKGASASERSCLMSRFRRLLLIPLLGLGLLLAGVLPTHASSHREAPLISEDPVADDTDAYAFVSPDRPDTVTLIGNWIPLEEPAGGPNFYKIGQDVRYEVKIGSNAASMPDGS